MNKIPQEVFFYAKNKHSIRQEQASLFAYFKQKLSMTAIRLVIEHINDKMPYCPLQFNNAFIKKYGFLKVGRLVGRGVVADPVFRQNLIKLVTLFGYKHQYKFYTKPYHFKPMRTKAEFIHKHYNTFRVNNSYALLSNTNLNKLIELVKQEFNYYGFVSVGENIALSQSALIVNISLLKKDKAEQLAILLPIFQRFFGADFKK